MTPTSSRLSQATHFIAESDFAAAIGLLSAVEQPAPDELHALADAQLLGGFAAWQGEVPATACQEAIAPYATCYRECSNPAMACTGWAVAAAWLGDAEELARALEAAVEVAGDPWAVVLARLDTGQASGPEEGLGHLIQTACDRNVSQFIALDLHVHWLTEDHQWQRAHNQQHRVVAASPDGFRELVMFPVALARYALLSDMHGEDAEYLLDWAEELAPEHRAVTQARLLLALDGRERRARKAKELLTGTAATGNLFADWLAADVDLGEDEAGDDHRSDGERETERPPAPSIYEAMGRERREKMILELLVKAIRRGE